MARPTTKTATRRAPSTEPTITAVKVGIEKHKGINSLTVQLICAQCSVTSSTQSSSSRLYFSTGGPFSPYMGLICQGVLRAYRHIHTPKVYSNITKSMEVHVAPGSSTHAQTTYCIHLFHFLSYLPLGENTLVVQLHMPVMKSHEAPF